MHDYNYGVESQQFTFFRVPKVLVTEQEYEGLTYDAMFMYGVMLDRMSLSSQNGWMDDEGRVYIIFTIEELMTLLNCSDRKVSKLLDELENGYDLIKRKRQGLGKPNVIYVKKFMNYGDVRNQNRKNYDSRIEKITIQESKKLRCNNTEYNNTESNKNILSPSVPVVTAGDNISATQQSTQNIPPIPALPPMTLSDNSLYRVSAEDVAFWKECYPAVDVEQELRNMAGWCMSNVKNRKTKRGINAFITTWLSKEQNKGGSKGKAQSKQTAPDFHHSSKAYKCASFLDRKNGENIAGYVPATEAVLQEWATDIDALSRVDGYDMEVVGDVIAFAMQDEFWKDKILTGRKFREKFVTLMAQMRGAENGE